jgi:DNA-binding beta-propeller fold protein YncE
VLYTVPVKGFSACSDVVPSHGISLSPDEHEVYLMDGCNSYVHVFDVSGLPALPPVQVADIRLSHQVGGTSEPGCAYDCGREGWVLHSGDGRYVLVGDDGDVIDTSTRGIVANIATLYDTRKFIEIDWENGTPAFTTNRYGLGYVGAPIKPPAP